MCAATDTEAVEGPGTEAGTVRGAEEGEDGVILGLSLARVSANLFLLASAASLFTTVIGEVEKRGLLVA